MNRFLLLFTIFPHAPVSASTPERPDIIVILMDDMGYNDIGSMTCPDPPNRYPASGVAPSRGGLTTTRISLHRMSPDS